LPTWRRWANNWFGLVPLLTRVLPPSFNPNELYDPLKQLETPFVFPFSVESFYGMTVGSIRSWALSGGVNLGVDLADFIDKKTSETFEKLENLDPHLPYSVFATGEHRINVLRRDENTAWIGLSKVKRVGHSINLSLGDKLYLLRGALAATAKGSVGGKPFDWDWVWQGVPLAMFPLDVKYEQALAKLFDQVYEYDLRNPVAQKAYLAAVKGDFAPSRARYLAAHEQGEDTGVTFHFTRTQDRVEEEIRNGPNVGVFRSVRENDRSRAEVEITDQEGKFYVLEGKQDTTDKRADILVGQEEERVQDVIELNVRRVVGKGEDPADFTYAFVADEEPQRMTMSFSLQDGYTTSVEYADYLAGVRFFTHLPIEDAPEIEIQDADRLVERRQLDYFVSPAEEVTTLHVMPTFLGRFAAQAAISLSAEQIDRILQASEDDKWRAFAKAFGQNPKEWGKKSVRESFWHQSQWFKAFVLYPFRLVNLRFPAVDAIKEATNAIEALAQIAAVDPPLQKLAAFYKLFDADHPSQLAHALLLLTDLDKVPRSVTFTTQPKGSARKMTKEAFGRLNRKTYSAGPVFPKPSRYARANQKMAAFYLDQPRDAADRPSINKIQVTTKEIPSSVRELTVDDEDVGGEPAPADGPLNRGQHVFITLQARNLWGDAPPNAPAKIYVRVEQGGKVKFGKLRLAEKVLELQALQLDTGLKMETQIFEFFLTGPLSPLSNFMFDRSVASGDEFAVTLAVSKDGTVWSDERQLEFRFGKGKLLPAQ
jgi:hypothetical protein